MVLGGMYCKQSLSIFSTEIWVDGETGTDPGSIWECGFGQSCMKLMLDIEIVTRSCIPPVWEGSKQTQL
jgi:hypothetical protein